MDPAPAEDLWGDDSFRRVDTSLTALVRQLALALAGLAGAYLAARWTTEELVGVEPGAGGIPVATAIHVLFAGVTLFLTSARPIRRDVAAQRRLILRRDAELTARVAEQGFLRGVHDALEMAETEDDVLGVVSAALTEAAHRPAELLVADASRAHLARRAVAVGHQAPGCSVATPWGCPAVRRGQTTTFPDSTRLAVCPRLRERAEEPMSAICVPVTILGTPTAVLHATGPAGPDAWGDLTVRRLEGVAVQLGTRLGVLRAMARSQLQAETDPLTGLLNRRALEERVRALRAAGTPFALVLADLDHFKSLNDRFGHDLGDRALRTFARVLQSAFRDEDLVCRHGGEEFVAVLPGLDRQVASQVLVRVQEGLERAVAAASLPPFTASFGVADSTDGVELAEILRAADEALLQAKAAGRDRIVLAAG